MTHLLMTTATAGITVGTVASLACITDPYSSPLSACERSVSTADKYKQLTPTAMPDRRCPALSSLLPCLAGNPP